MAQHPNNSRSAWAYGAAAVSLAVLGTSLVYYIVEDDKKVKRRKAAKKAERAALRTLQQIKDEAANVEKKMNSVNISVDTVHDDDKTFKQKEYTLAHSNELLLRLMERLDAIRPLELIQGDNTTVQPNEFEEHLAANVRSKKRGIIELIEGLFRQLDFTNGQLKEKATQRDDIAREKAARLAMEKEEAERLAREKEEAVRQEKEKEAEEEQARIAQEEAQRRQREKEEEERLANEEAAKEALAKELENAVEALGESTHTEVIESHEGDEEDAAPSNETEELKDEERTGSDHSNDIVEVAIDEVVRSAESQHFEHVEKVNEEAVEERTEEEAPEAEPVTDNNAEETAISSSILKVVEGDLEDEAMEKDTTVVEKKNAEDLSVDNSAVKEKTATDESTPSNGDALVEAKDQETI